MEVEDDDEAEMLRPETQVLNRQVTNRVRQIQCNIKVGDLSMKTTCN